MPIPPPEIIKPTVTISYRLLSRLLKAQVSVFMFGAESTGKTAFVKRLEGCSSLQEIFGAGSSSGYTTEHVWFNPRPGDQPNSIRLFFIDMGGHAEFSLVRRDVFTKFLPLGTLLFLDHRASNKRGRDNEQIDDGTVDDERILRHKQTFNELITMIRNEPRLKKACQAIVIVVNKSDLWRGKVNKDYFSNEFRPEITKLMEVSGIHDIPLLSCSVRTGDGIIDVIRTLFKRSGWEVPLPFGKKIPFKASLLK